ncbi:MAG: restriction endonuclease subunit S [Brevefilum sp.]|nr:restriction endonuclease subunit S [Brevefilum sp.]
MTGNDANINEWRRIQIGDSLKIVRGISFPKNVRKEEPFTGSIACLRTKNVQHDVEWDDLWFVPEQYMKRDEQLVRTNDILISTANSLELVGKVAQVKDMPYRATLGAFISLIRVPSELNPRFIYYQLSSPKIQNELHNVASTTTNISNISTSKLSKISLNIPPLDEQEKIVEKIEELLSQLDAGVAGLKRAKAELQRYRASVLKAAFEGRLVPQDPDDEPIKKVFDSKGIKFLEKAKFPQIPENYVWSRLENCIDILDSKRVPINSKIREKRIKDKKTSELYPYYGATGQVGLIDDYIFDEELVLLGEDGAPFLDVNKDKAYIVKGKFWVNNHAHVLRAKNDLISNRFLLHYLNFFDFKDFVTGTTRLKLNQANMKSILIILPPINEQNRIVNEIDKRLSIVSEISKSIEVGFRDSEFLRNTILKSAFTGELKNR